jgi:hypothetical protein
MRLNEKYLRKNRNALPLRVTEARLAQRLTMPLRLSVAGQIRDDIVQLSIADFRLARDRHAVQPTPNYRFDERGREIGSLFEHGRNSALVFQPERQGAWQRTGSKHSSLGSLGSVARRAPLFENGFPVLLGRSGLGQSRIRHRGDENSE